MLRKALPRAVLHYLPWVIEARAGAVPDHAARADVMFLGGFAHPPNADAVRWFVGAVLPILRTLLPDIRLHVYGAAIPPDIAALASEAVVIGGHVSDLAAAFDHHRAMIAPLRFGAGFKGKVAEALANGLPVIASPVAADGTGLRHDREILVAEDPTAFAMSIARLERDAATWQRLSAAGLAHAAAEFSPARGRQHLANVLHEIGRDDLLGPG